MALQEINDMSDTQETTKKDLIDASHPAKTGSLQTLLEWDGNLAVEDTIKIKRIDGFVIDVTVTPVPPNVVRRIEKECTNFEVQRGIRMPVIDDDKQAAMMAMIGIVDPNLNDEELQAQFNKSDNGRKNQPYMILDKLFLSGEQAKIAGAILNISGFDDRYLNQGQKLDEDINLQ